MRLPHERGCAYRRPAFWGLAALAAVIAVRDLPFAEMAAAVAVTAAISVGGYFYALWLGRLDARRGARHPRKLHVTGLVGFYAPLAVAAVFVVARPWLVALPGKTPFERASGLLVVPFLLSVAAGALRAAYDANSVG